MQKRSHFRKSNPLEDHAEDSLADAARKLRDEARLLPPGDERDELLQQARENEWTSQMTGWLNSPELQPPK